MSINLIELERMAHFAGYDEHSYKEYFPDEDVVLYMNKACNAVPKLIKRIHELERQRYFLAKYVKERAPNSCLNCPASCKRPDFNRCIDRIIQACAKETKSGEQSIALDR